MSDERQEWVEVPGGCLWAITSGHGMPLVLCHGGPGSYDYLAPVAGLLDDVAQVHRFDQRGGGRSTSSEPVSIATLVADIEALRAHWRRDRWIVAGHSWGAHLALFYALTYPGRAVGLVLLGSTGIRWGWRADRQERRLSKLTASERAEVLRLEAELAAGAGEEVRGRLRDLLGLADFASRHHALANPRPTEFPTDPAVLSALEADWQSALDGIDERLGYLDMPALVVHGESDPIGDSGPRELAELLPQGRFESLDGVGHMPWIEDPGALRMAMTSFVQQCASPEPRLGGTS